MQTEKNGRASKTTFSFVFVEPNLNRMEPLQPDDGRCTTRSTRLALSFILTGSTSPPLRSPVAPQQSSRAGAPVAEARYLEGPPGQYTCDLSPLVVHRGRAQPLLGRGLVPTENAPEAQQQRLHFHERVDFDQRNLNGRHPCSDPRKWIIVADSSTRDRLTSFPYSQSRCSGDDDELFAKQEIRNPRVYNRERIGRSSSSVGRRNATSDDVHHDSKPSIFSRVDDEIMSSRSVRGTEPTQRYVGSDDQRVRHQAIYCPDATYPTENEQHPATPPLAQPPTPPQILSTHQRQTERIQATVSTSGETETSFESTRAKTTRRCRRRPAMNAEEKRLARQCKVDGCTNYTIDRGLCFRHGGGKTCSVEGCTTSAKARGLCWRHGGSTLCTMPGCKRGAKSKGLCWSHGGGTQCTVQGCDKTTISRGLCWTHGGGKRCVMDGCKRPASESTHNFCQYHHDELRNGETTVEV